MMTEDLIKALVADHRAVRPFRIWPGWTFAASGVLAGAVACHLAFGIRPDILAGTTAEIVLIRSATLLMLGLASLVATASLARPGVGNNADGWLWTTGLAALFPATALVYAVTGRFPSSVLYAPSGVRCLLASSLIALVIAGGLIFWLRRAAPVRPQRLGWTVGLAAGSFGTLSYSLTCESSGMIYVGLWYSMAVLGSAVACRLAVPRILRW